MNRGSYATTWITAKSFRCSTPAARRNDAFSRRVWRRLVGDRPYPSDAWWLRRSHPIALHSHFGYVAARDVGVHAFLDTPWLVSFYGADVYELRHSRDWQDEYARLFARVSLVLALGPHMAIGLEQLGCPNPRLSSTRLALMSTTSRSREHVLAPGGSVEDFLRRHLPRKKGSRVPGSRRRRSASSRRSAAGHARRRRRLEARRRGNEGGDLREIERLGMEDVVTHRAYVPFNELMEMSLASHVFVAPSVTSATGDAEGTPFVLQQMMATGIPVIATTHSDIPFIFGTHRDQLVPERDAPAIATRLQRYSDDPEQVTRDGMVMREQIRSAFDVRVRAAALSDIYDFVSGCDRPSQAVGKRPASPQPSPRARRMTPSRPAPARGAIEEDLDELGTVALSSGRSGGSSKQGGYPRHVG